MICGGGESVNTNTSELNVKDGLIRLSSFEMIHEFRSSLLKIISEAWVIITSGFKLLMIESVLVRQMKEKVSFSKNCIELHCVCFCSNPYALMFPSLPLCPVPLMIHYSELCSYCWQVGAAALKFVLSLSPITRCSFQVIGEGWGSGSPPTWL